MVYKMSNSILYFILSSKGFTIDTISNHVLYLYFYHLKGPIIVTDYSKPRKQFQRYDFLRTYYRNRVIRLIFKYLVFILNMVAKSGLLIE